MRLKEDKHSWHASGLIKKDLNQDKSIDGATGPAKKVKNKRSWCGKKRGKKHRLVWRENKRWTSMKWRKEPVMEIACDKCHKSFYVEWDWFRMFQKDKKTLTKSKAQLLEEWQKKLGL